jgi:hypothetical protein
LRRVSQGLELTLGDSIGADRKIGSLHAKQRDVVLQRGRPSPE